MVGLELLELPDFVVWVFQEESVEHIQPGWLALRPRAVASGLGHCHLWRLWRV